MRPRRPWPFPVMLGGMVIFGAACAALRIGIAAEVVLAAIAATLGMGRP